MENERGKVNHVEEALEHLKLHGSEYKDYIADFVAATCDVTKEEMLSKSNKSNIVQSRWLLWYSYRYAMHVTYGKIASITKELGGHRYTMQCVAAAANKMSELIHKDVMWAKRWRIIKEIIKEHNEGENADNTITINIPKELKGKINIQIKEK